MASRAPAQDREIRLHIGTYAKAGGKGLYPLIRDADGWRVGAPYPEARNASFGVYSPRFRCHYFLDESEKGGIGGYRRKSDAWELVASASTKGSLPCHVALDPSETWLAIANYGSGSLSLLRLDSNGLPSAPAQIFVDHGRGPNAERQDAPHVHCAAWSADGRWLYFADLGTDRVRCLPLENGPTGDPLTVYQAPPGSGPRQLVLHPHRPCMLLLCELSSELIMLEMADGTLRARETRSTLPANYRGHSLGGHLAINAAGDRVYVTNRGHDSVAVFALDSDDGLELLQHVPAGGVSPRFFLLLEDERQLLLANEKDGNVTAFAIDDDGRLSSPSEIARVPGAAFLLREHL